MTTIKTPAAPEPIGPYSQAVLHKGLLFTSGQIAIDPETGEMIAADIEAETHWVMENLKAVLRAAETDFNNVLKAMIYLRDMDDFPVVNRVYGSYFDGKKAPARETVQVARLPKDAGVEISVIAVSALPQQ